MIWLLGILLLLIAIVVWLLVAPLVIEIDSRVPVASFRWVSIGSGSIYHKEEWRLRFRVFFFGKDLPLADMARKKKAIQPEKEVRSRPRKKRRPRHQLRKAWQMLKTIRVTRWQLAIDTGDYVQNAKLYPLNFLPYTFRHLEINFCDENYLVLHLRARPWKMLLAYLK